MLAKVQDICDTGEGGYKFLKLDTGMTDILRPSLYGAQHPICILQKSPDPAEEEYIVSGHCCESGDILTPAAGDPEGLSPRQNAARAHRRLLRIGGAGAYCALHVRAKLQLLPRLPRSHAEKGRDPIKLIRRRQTLAQILENETPDD